MAGTKTPLGRVLTFYSYKGGTGRSMAMANVAWILASAGRRVLAIDWDLEAPGLHRYFRPFLIDEELASSDGLMDLVDNYASAAIRPTGEATPDPDWYVPFTDFSDHTISIRFPLFPAGGRIDLMPAGRQGEHYATMVSTFNWQNFYDRLGGGGFFEALKDRAREQYDYILIDSRTGVSDTAGICSVQMPETLVACFTYNNQSIKGASGVAHSAAAMRHKIVGERLALADPTFSHARIEMLSRPYRVFPVPMRVDSGESERLAIRQAFAQHAFQDLIQHLSPDVVSRYWKSVEVPHTSFYSYEEVLAPFKDDPNDPKTVLAALLTLTRYITDGDVADFRMPISTADRQRYLDQFAETSLTTATRKAFTDSQRETGEQELVRAADAAVAALGGDDREAARRILMRLVRVGGDNETARYSLTRVPVSEFSREEEPVIARLVKSRVIALTAGTPDEREVSAGLADPRLLSNWSALIGWLESDREFLRWRQQLRLYLADWERSGHDHGALLTGRLLSEADLYSLRRNDDLNAVERRYIAESRAAHAAATLPAPLPPPDAPKTSAGLRFLPWAVVGAVVIAGFLAVTLTRRAPAADQEPNPSTPGNAIPVAVVAPQLIGLTAAEAQGIVEKLGLKIALPAASSTLTTPLEGVVVEQTPAAGENIEIGESVRVLLSTRTRRVPAVIGLSLNSALKQLESAELKLGVPSSVYVPNATQGAIVSQTPSAGAEVGTGTAIEVAVARAPQLSDFRFGIYYQDSNYEAKMLAQRLIAFLKQNETAGEALPRDDAFFARRLQSPSRHEIRYSTPVERRMAEELLERMKVAEMFPPFALRAVALKSEGFITVVLAETPATAK